MAAGNQAARLFSNNKRTLWCQIQNDKRKDKEQRHSLELIVQLVMLFHNLMKSTDNRYQCSQV